MDYHCPIKDKLFEPFTPSGTLKTARTAFFNSGKKNMVPAPANEKWIYANWYGGIEVMTLRIITWELFPKPYQGPRRKEFMDRIYIALTGTDVLPDGEVAKHTERYIKDAFQLFKLKFHTSRVPNLL